MNMKLKELERIMPLIIYRGCIRNDNVNQTFSLENLDLLLAEELINPITGKSQDLLAGL